MDTSKDSKSLESGRTMPRQPSHSPPPPPSSFHATMFGPLRDPDDFGDVFGGDWEDIELDDLPGGPSRASAYHHSRNMEVTRQDTTTERHDLEGQRRVAKSGRVFLELLTLCCCVSSRNRKQNARGGKCDKCLTICLIAKTSFCALLAAALTCLVLALLVLVIRNIPEIDLIIQKVGQIATGLDPQVPPTGSIR